MEANITKKKEWVAIAAAELKRIQKRWKKRYQMDISSFRKLKNVLEMNDRTLRKLNPSHLDYSLNLESMIELYNRLFVVCDRCLEGMERMEEHQLLLESVRMVMVKVGHLPPDLAERAAKRMTGERI